MGGTNKRYATVGDVIVVAVHNVIPMAPLGGAARAIVVRTKRSKAKDGSYIRFDENAAVLINDTKRQRDTYLWSGSQRAARQTIHAYCITAPEVVGNWGTGY